MKRRNFVKRLPILGSAPFLLNGISTRLMAETSPLSRLASTADNDKVLVLLQMHGGNDGVNTVIPIEQYDLYYSRRANIAIPYKNGQRRLVELDGTLASEDQVGLHPDMKPLKDLYDQGKVKIVQGVSYRNANGSHFRGRDVMFMGGGNDDYFTSGWVGRYFQKAVDGDYPDDFPNTDYPDPLALELGTEVSLVFHQEGNIPTSVSLGGDPDTFGNLVAGLEGFMDEGLDARGMPPEFLNKTAYGEELNWILSLEDKTEEYAERLQKVYNRAPRTSVEYPEVYPFASSVGSKRNPLSRQFQLIARLLDGGGPGMGVTTKVFMVTIGGFDTHARQSEDYDPTMGVHAALLHHIAHALKAFQDDLRARGIEDRVLTVSTSEFGRRVHSNGSFGTDHGTGAPVMIVGKHVDPGMLGTNPDMNQNNVGTQFDYRQIYAHILRDWFEVDETTIRNDIFFGNFFDGPSEFGGNYEELPIIRKRITSLEQFKEERFHIKSIYPNPARDLATLHFYINGPRDLTIQVYDLQGRKALTIARAMFPAGEHQLPLDVHDLNPGIYICHIEGPDIKLAKKLWVRR